MPDITKPIEQTPKVVCTPTTLPARTPRADTGTLPKHVILLQEVINRTMGHLLMTRSSLDACQWKQVSDFEMALCLNEAEATEAIRDAKAHCGTTIRETEACCTTHIREAKAHHTTHIREAENDFTSHIRDAEADYASITIEAEACSTADIRKVESHCAEHACSIQQSHVEGMQHLEMEAMEEEGRDHLSFLAACGMALQACPLEAHGVLMGPLQLLMAEHFLGHSPKHSPSGVFHQGGIFPCDFPCYYSSSTQTLLGNQMMTPFT